MVQKLCRLVFWLLIAAVVFVTLAPIADRPVSGSPANIEQFAAFALMGLIGSVGYPKHRVWLAVALIAVAGALEALQELSPSRHSREADFAVKALASVIGVGVGFVPFLSSVVWRGKGYPAPPRPEGSDRSPA